MSIIDRISLTKDIDSIGMDFLPSVAKFEICGLCTLRCKFCGVGKTTASKRSRMVTSEEYDMFLDFIRQIPSIREVALFYYGESGLHPKLADFYKKLKDNGYFTFLTTNGTIRDNIMNALPYIDSLKVSWNYTDYEDFHKKTGGTKNQFEDIISNIAVFYDTLHTYNKRLSISTILDGDRKLYEDSLNTLKYDEHYWLPLYSMNGVNENGASGQNLGEDTQSLPCSQLFRFLHVDSNLNVRTCFCGHNDSQILYNIRDMKFHIPEKLKELREYHLRHEIPAECEKCLSI